MNRSTIRATRRLLTLIPVLAWSRVLSLRAKALSFCRPSSRESTKEFGVSDLDQAFVASLQLSALDPAKYALHPAGVRAALRFGLLDGHTSASELLHKHHTALCRVLFRQPPHTATEGRTESLRALTRRQASMILYMERNSSTLRASSCSWSAPLETIATRRRAHANGGTPVREGRELSA